MSTLRWAPCRPRCFFRFFGRGLKRLRIEVVVTFSWHIIKPVLRVRQLQKKKSHHRYNNHIITHTPTPPFISFVFTTKKQLSRTPTCVGEILWKGRWRRTSFNNRDLIVSPLVSTPIPVEPHSLLHNQSLPSQYPSFVPRLTLILWKILEGRSSSFKTLTLWHRVPFRQSKTGGESLTHTTWRGEMVTLWEGR